MTFKQGDIVAYPNSNLMMQVLTDSNEDTTSCFILLEFKHSIFVQHPSCELVRASVH